MKDARCHQCQYEFDWKAELKVRPPCPRCKAEPRVIKRPQTNQVVSLYVGERHYQSAGIRDTDARDETGEKE